MCNTSLQCGCEIDQVDRFIVDAISSYAVPEVSYVMLSPLKGAVLTSLHANQQATAKYIVLRITSHVPLQQKVVLVWGDRYIPKNVMKCPDPLALLQYYP